MKDLWTISWAVIFSDLAQSKLEFNATPLRKRETLNNAFTPRVNYGDM